MAELVRSELQLEAMLCLAIRRHHNARVAHEDVEPKAAVQRWQRNDQGVEIDNVKLIKSGVWRPEFPLGYARHPWPPYQDRCTPNRLGPMSRKSTYSFKADGRVGARYRRPVQPDQGYGLRPTPWSFTSETITLLQQPVQRS